MTEKTPALMTFYGGWGTYQRMLVELLAPLSRDQLDLAAAPEKWTVGMLAQHIVANRVWWFHHWMGEGEPDLAPIAHWDPADSVEVPAQDAASLVEGLEATWRVIESALERWTAADLPQEFPPPAVMSVEEREMFGNASRKWIVWHVLEHEIHHGGEISLLLGNHGLPGIYGEM